MRFFRSPHPALHFLALFFLAVGASAEVPDAVHLRFSEASLAALAAAEEGTFFALNDHVPSGKYDAKTQKLDIGPTLAWLQERQKQEKPLSPHAFSELKKILLSPSSHYKGLFNVTEPAVLAVAFRHGGQTGILVLHENLVFLLWDGTNQAALLNDSGSRALSLWMKPFRQKEGPS
jgi:hypothetical protein